MELSSVYVTVFHRGGENTAILAGGTYAIGTVFAVEGVNKVHTFPLFHILVELAFFLIFGEDEGIPADVRDF